MSDETPTGDPTPTGDATSPDATPETTPPGIAAATPPGPGPTSPEPGTATDPASAPTAPAMPTPVAAVAPPQGPRTVAVPMWLLVTLAAVIGAAAMFGIGYAVGDSGDSDSTAVSPPLEQVPPRAPERPDPEPRAPQAPNVPAAGAFLGVAAQPAGDGLEITRVVPGSAADDAGLEVGDVIVEFDGDEVTSPDDLADAVAALDPGDEVEIAYERDGARRTVTVELGARGATSNS